MMETQTALATLATEGVQIPDAEQTEAGPRSVTLLRPVGTPLRNDGIRHHWLSSGQEFRVAYDGVGWRVTPADGWADGHVYRLAEVQDCRLVGELPTDAGVLVLTEGSAYDLRESSPGVWAVYEA